MINYSVDQLLAFDKRLKRVKKRIQNQEKWVKVYGFPDYQVSSLGRVRCKRKVYYKKSPFSEKICKNVLKPHFLAPLYCGYGAKWPAIRFSIGKNQWKQYSLAKVIVASFLKMDMDILPHSIFYIDRNPYNSDIQNLSFMTDKMRRNL